MGKGGVGEERRRGEEERGDREEMERWEGAVGDEKVRGGEEGRGERGDGERTEMGRACMRDVRSGALSLRLDGHVGRAALRSSGDG